MAVGPLGAIRNQDFGRVDATKQRTELLSGNFTQGDAARSECYPGGADARAGRVERHEMVLPAFIHQRGVTDSAGGDDTGDGPFDGALGGGRVANLFADGHRFAGFDEASDVLVRRMKRHARHADGFAIGLAAAGQRDVEQPGGLDGIIEKQLVEVAHPVEEQRLRYRCLDGQKLAHHRRMRCVRISGVGSGFLAHCANTP